MPKQNRLTQQHLLKHPEKINRFNKVRIWSNEWKQWWKPKAQGYSPDIKDAGIYDAKDAFRRVRHCGPEKKIVLIGL